MIAEIIIIRKYTQLAAPASALCSRLPCSISSKVKYTVIAPKPTPPRRRRRPALQSCQRNQYYHHCCKATTCAAIITRPAGTASCTASVKSPLRPGLHALHL
eukprot:TRINITY_DN20028_c0_g1_i2.p1 TRINITY_DN20028_c0_g1~~TRINITY_DN20028_c0_g1_i2.p1  ORF type:complete len:102 (-),score=8.66 TRINITY_DN20028_c0_g1_i2:84-389(-)